MGNFLLDIRDHQIAEDKALLYLTSSKLRQYYSSYKSICQSFSITITEYIQIFGPNEKSFLIFDTKKKGRIDSMQLFAGLIIFSNINYNQKIRFLFQIFDFNEQGYLNFEAVIFMITNICNATFKIYGINNTVHSKKVQSFFSEYFSVESQIKLDKFIKWSRKIQQFYIYFMTIGHQFEPYQQVKQIDRYQTQQAKDKCIEYKLARKLINSSNFQNQSKTINKYQTKTNKKEDFRINFQFDQKLLNTLQLICQKNDKTKNKNFVPLQPNEQNNQKDQNFNPNLSWLYGINLKINSPLKFLKLKSVNSSNEVFIYTLNNIIIMYYPKINIQKYYLGHYSEITSFQISNNKQMIASADLKGANNSLPQIHIWKGSDCQRLVKLACMHKGPIKCLKWINNDRYLVSVSEDTNWAINITDIITQENILSTYLTEPVLDILYTPFCKTQHPLFTKQYFIVYSYNSITYFYQLQLCNETNNNRSEKEESSYQKQQKNYILATYYINLVPIICITQSSSRKQLVTAHNDGSIRIWDHQLNLNQIVYKLDNKDRSIIKIEFLNANDLMVLFDQTIQILNFTNNSSTLKTMSPFIIQIPKKLFNLIFIDIVIISETQILLLSLFGQVLKIQKLSQPYDLDLITFRKYYQIFHFQGISDYCQVGQQYFYIASNNLIYKINVDEHQLSVLKVFQYQINCISGYGDYHAILTTNQSKYVYVMFAQKIVEKVKLVSNVYDIKLTDNHLILCSQKKIQYYVKSYDKYLNLESKKIQFEDYNPIFLIQTQQPTKFIVITKQKQIFSVDIRTQVKQKIKNNLSLQEPYLQMIYPYSNNFPLLFYPKQNFICMGFTNGQIRVWNSIQSLRFQTQNYFKLIKHGSQVKKIKMLFYEDKEELVTIGASDGMVVVYEHKQYLEGEYDQSIEIINEKNGKTFNIFQQQISSFQCNSQKRQSNILKDSQMEVYLFEDNIPTWISTIIQKIIYPQCTNYQPLSINWQKNSVQKINKHVTISLNHVFGFASEKIRNSLFYTHQHADVQKQKKQFIEINKQNYQESELTQTQKNFYNKFNFQSQKLQQIEQIHEKCKRQIVFFVDCMLILMKPEIKQQKFYTFHNYKVTACQIHPNKKLVCSAQNSPFHPTIHIWNTNDLLMIRNIRCKHKSPINIIQFSKNGQFIITLAQFHKLDRKTTNNLSNQSSNFYSSSGQNLQTCSIEVIDWKYSSCILHRILPCQQALAIKLNPYNWRQLCIAGKQFLQIYEITSTNLLCLQKLNPPQTITCLAYTSSLYGNQIQSDIITGNQSGCIGLYICGKYVIIKKGHEGPINFIQMHQLFKYKTVIVTGGEDYWVKVWDTKFVMITSLNIRDQLIIGKQFNEVLKFNFSPQSLDLYCCFSQKKSQQTNQHIFLIGTRNGYIIQAKISNQYQGLKIIQSNKEENGKEKLNFNVTIVSSNNFSDQYNQFQLCENNLMITYSATYPIIFLWTTLKKQIIKFVRLKGSPSIIKYDSNIKRVYIGYFKHSVIESFRIVQQNLILQEQINIKPDHYPDLIQIGGVGCNYLAVSLICHNSYPDQMMGSNTLNLTGNFISVYEIKQNWKMCNDNKKQFEFKFKIQNKKNINVFWMQFSSFSHQELLILYTDKKIKQLEGTLTDQHSEKISKNSQFSLWSLIEKKQIQYTNQQFLQLNFCPFIRVQYITYPKLKIDHYSLNNQEKWGNKNPFICQMAQFNKYTIIGTSCGELLFINSDFFCNKQKNQKSINSSVCKYYHLCSNPITKIIVDKNFIYVKSGKNSGILKLQVSEDCLAYQNQKLKDQFNLIMNSQILNKYLKVVYPKRKYIYESRINFSQKGQLLQKQISLKKSKGKQKKQNISLDLITIMGRNSIYKRNNIFVDLKNNIISHVGCNLIMFYKQKQKNMDSQNSPSNIRYKQKFIKPDNSPFSTFAQISALTISEDRKILYVGTSQQNSKILVLDISTQTNFKQIVLNGIIQIKILKVSQKKQHAIVYGVDTKGKYLILFLSLYQCEVLGVYVFKFWNQQINDLNFIPGKQFSFITCGNNHMMEWKFDGLLNFQSYNLNNPPDFMQLNQKSQKNTKNNVIFYSIIFLKQTAVTSASDGYLYLWNDKKIIKKQNAHPKAPILCLYASKNSKIFASGAADGKVIIWLLSSSSIIQKIFQFSIYQGKQIKIPIKYHVQSVCISKNNIIVGTRSGQIYQFLCNDAQNQIQEKQIQQLKKGPQLILSAYDDDLINSCSFNTSSERLFILTQSGFFSVFNIKSMQKLKQQKIQIGKSQIIKMLVCKYSPRIFIILNNSIMVYYYISQNKQEKSHKFRRGKESHKPLQNNSIKKAYISPNQKYLALLTSSAKNQLYLIQIFDLSTPSQGSFYNQFNVFQNIPIDTQTIDFSTDSGYLMHKTKQQEQTIHNLVTGEIINSSVIQFQLDWADQAKKITKSVRDILLSYGDQNNLLKLVQVMNHSIIATDQMGSIRIFQYPFTPHKQSNKQGKSQQTSYYRIYLEHLNEVYICVVSMNSNFLVTVGKEDRSLMIWKVKVDQNQSN